MEIPTMNAVTIGFPGSRTARLLRVARGTPARAIIAALQLPVPAGVLCLNGGTEEPAVEAAEPLRRLLSDGLARMARSESLTVITGGTAAGIFALFGGGVAAWGTSAPVIGVAPGGPLVWPGGGQGHTPLEPHHSHFVIVEGKGWGDETATMYALAAEWKKDCPGVAVFAGGGEITLREMRANVQADRPMILLAGSGRSTDAVLHARQRPARSGDPLVEDIATRGKITAVSVLAEPRALCEAVNRALGRT